MKNNKFDGLLELISQDALYVDNSLIQTIGLYRAVIITELMSYRDKAKQQGIIDDDGYFLYTSQKLQKSINIGRTKAENAIKFFKKAKIINTTVKGMPASTYLKINHNAGELLNELINKKNYGREEI